MRDKIILFICFVLIGSMLLGQSGGADQPPVSETQAVEEKPAETVAVSMIGFGFLKRGSKDADRTVYIVELNYVKGKKVPLEGSVVIKTNSCAHLFPLMIHSAAGGISADIVIQTEKIISGQKKLIYKKIGYVRLKASTTEFKDKVQTGKLFLRVVKGAEYLAGKYDIYLNVLPETTIETSKKSSDKTKTSSTASGKAEKKQ